MGYFAMRLARSGTCRGSASAEVCAPLTIEPCRPPTASCGHRPPQVHTDCSQCHSVTPLFGPDLPRCFLIDRWGTARSQQVAAIRDPRTGRGCPAWCAGLCGDFPAFRQSAAAAACWVAVGAGWRPQSRVSVSGRGRTRRFWARSSSRLFGIRLRRRSRASLTTVLMRSARPSLRLTARGGNCCRTC
jgi:hypothetical protein